MRCIALRCVACRTLPVARCLPVRWAVRGLLRCSTVLADGSGRLDWSIAVIDHCEHSPASTALRPRPALHRRADAAEPSRLRPAARHHAVPSIEQDIRRPTHGLRRIHPSIQCAAYVTAHSIACVRHCRSAPAAASRQPLSRTSRAAAAAQPAALLSRGLARAAACGTPRGSKLYAQ